MRLLDQSQRPSLLMTGEQPERDVGLSSPCPQVQWSGADGLRQMPAHTVGALQKENTQFREPKSFITGRKQAYPLLWRKILS